MKTHKENKVMAKIDFNVNVRAIAQTKDMSCWAAASAMLLTWKIGINYSELMAAQAAGSNFVIAFNENRGVLSPEIVELAHALHLSHEAPQNFDALGWEKLLRNYGPLWVGTAIFGEQHVYRHVRVVRGIKGDGTSATELNILDPDGGREYRSTVAQFALELETIARQDMHKGTELLPQVLHF